METEPEPDSNDRSHINKVLQKRCLGVEYDTSLWDLVFDTKHIAIVAVIECSYLMKGEFDGSTVERTS